MVPMISILCYLLRLGLLLSVFDKIMYSLKCSILYDHWVRFLKSANSNLLYRYFMCQIILSSPDKVLKISQYDFVFVYLFICLFIIFGFMYCDLCYLMHTYLESLCFSGQSNHLSL